LPRLSILGARSATAANRHDDLTVAHQRNPACKWDNSRERQHDKPAAARRDAILERLRRPLVSRCGPCLILRDADGGARKPLFDTTATASLQPFFFASAIAASTALVA